MIQTRPAYRSNRRNTLSVAAFLYLLFVVYGSLVPLDFHPGPLGAAWQTFLTVPYLALDVGARADWVANILLYMPLAYLLSAAFAAGSRSAAARVMRVGVVLIVCASVALAVEFAQLFFPPRTVSLNDIVAEFIGSGLGVGIWLKWGSALERLSSQMQRGGLPAIRAAGVVYALGYATLSLFPYDFLVSAQEFSAKLAGGNYGLLVAPGACERLSICAAKLIAEIVVVVPLGVLLSMVLGKAAKGAYAIAILCGVVLGVTIETAQLLIASGVSQGISVLTRAVGVALGVALHRHVRWRWLSSVQTYALGVVLVATPAYLFALMWASGLFSAPWAGAEFARANLQEVNWLPFYYHYFSTETAALRSAMICAAMYMPVGFLYWTWTLRRAHTYSDGFALFPALIAAPLALAIELAKLFVPGKHPDPTDVLIATVAAVAAYLLAVLLQKWGLQGEAEVPPRVLESTRTHSSGGRMLPVIPATLLCGGLLISIALALMRFPVAPLTLAAALGLYFCLLLRYTKLWAFVITALLPVLDLAPWSGWLLFNELDLFFLATLAALIWLPGGGERRDFPLAAKVLLFLFALATAASVARGLFPWEAFSPDALSTFHTHYNALRVGRGVLWGFVLLALMRRTPDIEKQFVAGMVAGLILVGIVVLWEAIVFLGPFRFSEDYRVSGSFSAASTAGAQLESYLAAATPIAVFWVFRGGHSQRLLGALALALTAYAVAATVSRTSYLAEATALGLFAIAWGLSWRRLRIAGGFAGAILLILVATATAYVTSKGSAISSRFQEASSDFDVRVAHWRRVLTMMEPDWETTLLGMGLGSYPRTFLWKAAPAQRPAIFSFRRDQESAYVALGVGTNVYLEQFVEVAARRTYEMRVAVRSKSREGTLSVAVCEKWTLYSGKCIGFSPKVASTKGWQEFTFPFDAGDLGKGPSLASPPIKFALWNGGSSLLEVTRLQLLDADGRNLVLNGDFSRGGDRWYFSADDHFPWNIFNIFVEVFFEQGWVGLILFFALLIYCVLNLLRRTMQRDYLAMAHLAALGGFFVPALFDSVIDEPRMRTLLLLLMFLPFLSPIRVYGKRFEVVPDEALNTANRTQNSVTPSLSHNALNRRKAHWDGA